MEAKERCERSWHRLLSGVDTVSFSERCCRVRAFNALLCLHLRCTKCPLSVRPHYIYSTWIGVAACRGVGSGPNCAWDNVAAWDRPEGAAVSLSEGQRAAGGVRQSFCGDVACQHGWAESRAKHMWWHGITLGHEDRLGGFQTWRKRLGCGTCPLVCLMLCQSIHLFIFVTLYIIEARQRCFFFLLQKNVNAFVFRLLYSKRH